MISHINGRIKKKKPGSVVVDVNGISYEVMIPPAVMNSLEKSIGPEGLIELITYHYYQMDPSRAVPVLVGFLNEVEKDFFEQFITVSGVGPKAACRAMSLSFSVIAEAIDNGDMALLKTLPGIGEQKAREIIAKLQGKVGRFGLIQDRDAGLPLRSKENIKEEALSVLLQLQYKRNEAKDMIEKALGRNARLETCEDILNEVYRGSRVQGPGSRGQGKEAKK